MLTPLRLTQASQAVLEEKNPPAKAGDTKVMVRPLGQEDPLEEVMATHSRVLAWRIPWTEEPGEPQSWTRLSTHTQMEAVHLKSLQLPSSQPHRTPTLQILMLGKVCYMRAPAITSSSGGHCPLRTPCLFR